MRIARLLVAVTVSTSLVAYAQYGNTFDKIRYNGGTVQTKVGPKDWGNRLTVTSEGIRLDLKDGQAVVIDPKSVHGLSYGQEAHRRVGTMVALGILFAPLALFGLFHKTRLHFVGIEYTTPGGEPAGLLMQAHKKNYRAVLMALRGATGAPVAVSEEERKYVPTGVEVVETKAPGEADADEGKEQTGVVLLASDPEEAEVWVDGAFVGNTPARLSLEAGKHKIRISLAGYLDWERELSVMAGAEVNLRAVLENGPSM